MAEKIPFIDIQLDDGSTYKVKCSLRIINQFQLMTGRDLLLTFKDPFTSLEITQLIACAIFPKDTQEHLEYVADNLGANSGSIFVKLLSLLIVGREIETNETAQETSEEVEEKK